MTIDELAKQDPREMFDHDPREIQELLAEVHAELGDRDPRFSTDEDQLPTDEKFWNGNLHLRQKPPLSRAFSLPLMAFTAAMLSSGRLAPLVARVSPSTRSRTS